MIAMYSETDPKILSVLGRALGSSSRVLRLRAVAMLARVECDTAAEWLERAARDSDVAVRHTACIVSAWVERPDSPPWPQREDPALDLVPELRPGLEPLPDAEPTQQTWEYTIEVWRDDGFLMGAFLCTTRNEDDEHAKRIALGQAILHNSPGIGDRFDPATAAAFIISKCAAHHAGTASPDSDRRL
jgi:hypothetical protein